MKEKPALVHGKILKSFQQRYIGSKAIPPDTLRYCMLCDRKTQWRYDPVIGHSVCMQCGAH